MDHKEISSLRMLGLSKTSGIMHESGMQETIDGIGMNS